MLTDIFSRRYENVPMWQTLDEPVERVVVQAFHLVEQICPEDPQEAHDFWIELKAILARELGSRELSKEYRHGAFNILHSWMLEHFLGFSKTDTADLFVKERLSFVELAFRKREEAIAERRSKLSEQVTIIEKVIEQHVSSGATDAAAFAYTELLRTQEKMTSLNVPLQEAIDELNTRFKLAGVNLHYHNGFIQIATDAPIERQIEEPFWQLVADPKWKNVDHDMKEAIDLRDTGGRDPAFYAARALESTIKIISNDKKLSTGKERGAHNYIENLKRGGLIADWEMDALKAYFTELRNPLGHGPGSAEMPSLSGPQTDWAIESCMSWVKSLIRRI